MLLPFKPFYMKYLSVICLLLLHTTAFAQNRDLWYSFYNADSTLAGFKDANGVVKIEPKFKPFFLNGVFENIISVTEKQGEKYARYYLTKSGRKVGRDSVHIFDFTEDCEQEGFIRFRDHKADKGGLFNRYGDVVIPALYDGMTSVHNGLITVLQGAKKIVSEDGEHHFWEGGNQKLIDTNGRVLIGDFKYDQMINLNSLIVADKQHSSPVRKSFKGENGQFYSFINYEREFKAWLEKDLLVNLDKDKLLGASFSTIANPAAAEGWALEPKQKYIERYYERIKAKLLQLKDPAFEYSLFIDDLNPFIYESEEFKPYLNFYGQNRMPEYPVLEVVISYNITTPNFQQDYFEFLRTKEGYKLVSARLQKR